MIRVLTLPVWRTQLFLMNTDIAQVLERTAQTVNSFNHDLPLLLEQQDAHVRLTISRIPRLEGAAPDDDWFSRSSELLRDVLSGFGQCEIRSTTGTPRLTATIGIDPGSAGHHCHTADDLLHMSRRRIPEHRRYRIMLQVARAVTICVLNRCGTYLERGLEFEIERNAARFNSLLELASRLEQDQISVEDGTSGTISTFNLRSGTSGLSLPGLKLFQ